MDGNIEITHISTWNYSKMHALLSAEQQKSSELLVSWNAVRARKKQSRTVEVAEISGGLIRSYENQLEVTNDKFAMFSRTTADSPYPRYFGSFLSIMIWLHILELRTRPTIHLTRFMRTSGPMTQLIYTISWTAAFNSALQLKRTC